MFSIAYLQLALVLLSVTVNAFGAPSPQSGRTVYNQATKEQILARRQQFRVPRERRASSVPEGFAPCYTAPDYDAAVYSERGASIANGFIRSTDDTTLKGCIETCRATSGCKGALFGDEGRGEFYCALYASVGVSSSEYENARIIFLDTTCASNAANSGGAACCDV